MEIFYLGADEPAERAVSEAIDGSSVAHFYGYYYGSSAPEVITEDYFGYFAFTYWFGRNDLDNVNENSQQAGAKVVKVAATSALTETLQVRLEKRAEISTFSEDFQFGLEDNLALPQSRG